MKPRDRNIGTFGLKICRLVGAMDDHRDHAPLRTVRGYQLTLYWPLSVSSESR